MTPRIIVDEVIEKKLTENEIDTLKNKTKLDDWIADNKTKEFLQLVNNASAIHHSLRVISRMQLILPKEFDSALYHYLLTVEYVYTHL